MAFRRFRRVGARRRFRRKWDMQEYRECERLFVINTSLPVNCNTPFSTADLLFSNGSPVGGVLQSAGAGAGVVWGGSRGQIHYGVALIFDTNDPPTDLTTPCLLGINMMTAIVKLPLDNDRHTPLYIPNLLQAKSQLSVVGATQSDSVDSVLWRRQEQLRWGKFNFCIDVSDSCFPVRDTADAVCGTSKSGDGLAWIAATMTSLGTYGRTLGLGSFRARVKRRLNEREGIFLVRNFSLGFPAAADPPFNIIVQSNAWVQFAARQLR